jgi:hypothetical protein
MENSSEDGPGRSVVARIAVLLLILCVVYVLGVGPAVVWLNYGHPAGILFFNVYEPLIYLADHTPLGEPIYSYTHWWEEEMGQRNYPPSPFCPPAHP